MEKRIVEINGIKLEVDMTTARVVENYKVGDNVKVLIKEYSTYKSYPGVIIGFDQFVMLPTIIIAYLELSYSEAKIKFVHLNAETKDCEICPMLELEMPFEKHRVLELFNNEIEKEKEKIKGLERQRAYFLAEFGKYFKVEEAVI